MAKHLTKSGRCPICNNPIIRKDNNRPECMYMAIKSMRISNLDGNITGECPRCKIEVELPQIKVKKIEMSKVNANIFKKTN